jgi:hypothetical protein
VVVVAVFSQGDRVSGRDQPGSGGINFGNVQQHDGDVVLDGVNPAADAAFQAFAVRAQQHRLFAFGADQHVEEILRNHSGSILARI